ncbi:hypothetical protein Plhal703r1_c07g0039161 [Plasmopara halstedii]
MHAVVCCVIALVLLDAVVAININVVSKAISAIPAKNRDNEFYRVKIAATRRLRGHILATSKSQKETLQDEERVNPNFGLDALTLVSEAETLLDGHFGFPALSNEISAKFQVAGISDKVLGSIKQWSENIDPILRESDEEMDTMVKRIMHGTMNLAQVEEVMNRVSYEYFVLLSVIKAQKIIDIPKIPTLQQEEINHIKNGIFSFWKDRKMKPEFISQLLKHTDPPEENLAESYASYLSTNKEGIESSGARSG